MLQGKLKCRRQQVSQDFSEMNTEWESIESNDATRLIIQMCVTIILGTKLFKSKLLGGKEFKENDMNACHSLIWIQMYDDLYINHPYSQLVSSRIFSFITDYRR